MPLPLKKHKHRMGYTDKELRKYLSKVEYKKFCKNFGVQTCAMDPQTGETLYYGYDVERAVRGLDPLD